MTNTSVLNYLIESARQALKRGDKSSAKASLLTARYLAQKDANVTFEIYLIAKSEGDVNEAANCFTNVFLDGGQTLLKDDIDRIIDELKARHLHLESTNLVSSPPAAATRQLRAARLSTISSTSTNTGIPGQTSARTMSLDSAPDSVGGLFHTQLYNLLDEELQRSLVLYIIESCESRLEKSRLMLLAITLFGDNHPSIVSVKSRLVDNLLVVCGRLCSPCVAQKSDDTSMVIDEPNNSVPNSGISINFARAMLIADVIPRLLSEATTSIELSDSDLHELTLQTLKFYYDNCTKVTANESKNSLDLNSDIETVACELVSSSQRAHKGGNPIDARIDLTERQIHTALTVLARHLGCATLYEDVTDNSKTNSRLKQIAICLDQSYSPSSASSQPVSDDGKDKETSTPRARGRPKKNASTTPTKSTSKSQQQISSSPASEGQSGILTSVGLPDTSIGNPLYALIDLMLRCLTRHLRYTKCRVLLETTSNPSQSCPIVQTSSNGDDSNHRSFKRRKLMGAMIEKATEFVEQPSMVKFVRGYRTTGSSHLSHDTDNMDMESADPTNDEINAAGRNLIACVKCFRLLENHHRLSSYWRCMSNILLPVGEIAWYRLSIDALQLETDPMSPDLSATANLKCNLFEPIVEQMCKSRNWNMGVSEWLKLASYEEHKLEVNNNIIVEVCEHTIQSSDVLAKAANHDGGTEQNKINYAKLYKIDAPSGEDYVRHHTNQSHDQNDNRLMTFVSLSAESVASCSLSMLFDVAAERALSILDAPVIGGALSTRSAYAEHVDRAVGHLVVMSQFEWPRRSRMFVRAISCIRSCKPTSATPQLVAPAHKFTYAPFFRYILNPEIIEEFMALVRQGYTLDIRHQHLETISHHDPSGSNRLNPIDHHSTNTSGAPNSSAKDTKAITTRGLNKSYKDDMRAAFEHQIHLSTEIPPVSLLAEFAHSELIPWLKLSPTSASLQSEAKEQTGSQRRRRS